MDISIITSNISADFTSPPGVPSWDERKHGYIDVLLQTDPDIIGLQEVTPNQFHFVTTHLLDYSALSVPVNSPTQELKTAWKQKYEKFGLPEVPSPYEIILFYRTSVLEPLASGYWWLSPTPEVPSIGFGNTAPRVVLWAHLRQRSSAKEFVIFNTHIDHRSPTPMVELCRKKFSTFAEKRSSLILIGDLNFNEADPNYELLVKDGWRDTYEASHDTNSATFLSDVPSIPGGRIDHILYRSDELSAILWQRLVPSDAKQRISDHDPVHAKLRFG